MDSKKETKEKEIEKTTVVNDAPVGSVVSDKANNAGQVSVAGKPNRPQGPSGGRRFMPKNRPGGHRDRAERPKSEFEQKVLSVRRVTRVTAGGKRFNLSVAIALGNGKGQVGFGIGKGADTALAMEKAVRSAKKNMIHVNLTKSMSIPHDVRAKYSSSIVSLMPAPKRGLIAGSAVRDVLQIAGIKDVSGKIYSRSTNKINIGRATIIALSKLSKVKDNR